MTRHSLADVSKALSSPEWRSGKPGMDEVTEGYESNEDGSYERRNLR